MKKQFLSILVLLALGIAATAQIVNIPDVNFKAYLVGDTAINTDAEIQVSEASAFTGFINCPNSSISDLTGIEAFTALTKLNCYSNNLSALDVSQNIALTELRCESNNISVLDVSQNTALNLFWCHSNNLNSLDVSQNLALTNFICRSNNLSTLDVSQNTGLIQFWCNSNNLNTLDVSQNTALVSLFCNSNNLNTLDVSQNNSLTSLRCNFNNLAKLDVRQNIALTNLRCNSNNLDTLDVSLHTALTLLHCQSNNLSVLNMSNGNNSNMSSSDFYVTNNPNLACIQVDDSTYSASAWTNINPTTSFSTDCGYGHLVHTINVQGQGGLSTITTLGGTLQMVATVLPINADDSSYTWSIVNGTGSANIDASGLLTAVTNGTVNVIATANDGSGTKGVTIITITNQTVGVNDYTFKKLKAYPNPINDIINISVSDHLTSILLFNTIGKRIASFEPENRQLNISKLAPGVYFLGIANEEKKSVIKLIKE